MHLRLQISEPLHWLSFLLVKGQSIFLVWVPSGLAVLALRSGVTTKLASVSSVAYLVACFGFRQLDWYFE